MDTIDSLWVITPITNNVILWAILATYVKASEANLQIEEKKHMHKRNPTRTIKIFETWRHTNKPNQL
jgi:hypothetical protein